MNTFPRMFAVRQEFPVSASIEIRSTIERELRKVRPRFKAGHRIAVAVGSRGISNLASIVAAIVDVLKADGVQPFIVPAMGSHGGATAEGQSAVLAEYGVTEDRLQVPIKAGMDVERLGATEEGIDVYFSAEALRADGIVVVNRVKPHTDFAGPIGSGILKMLVIGLGKRAGAANFHASASRLGYEPVIRACARVALRVAPIICGVAIVEDQFHQTASIVALEPQEIESGEEKLFSEAKRLMPALPFDDIDLLVVDRIGKNISGAGMDPNVIGRGVHGYSSSLGPRNGTGPTIRRIFVRGLTPETHGNAIGIGLADITTDRLVNAIDRKSTFVNALTALTPQGAKIPIYFETDREALTNVLASLALRDPAQAKVLRIADTLSLDLAEVSEAYLDLARTRNDLAMLNRPREMKFDSIGNLLPISAAGG
jgi:hypothetical protein